MTGAPKPFTDLGKAPAHVERVVEAILDGDAERAIDLLCEEHEELVSYTHQKRLRDTILAGRAAA